VARLYVGNLSYDTIEEHLKAVFAPYGKVTRLMVLRDGESRRSKGFGFVEMPNPVEAVAAMRGLNGTELQGQQLVVQLVLQ
jgi:RNA recognition motif-containing protein